MKNEPGQLPGQMSIEDYQTLTTARNATAAVRTAALKP